eukprot:TRINITY_DN273_c0_g2_i1.p1 TRINITY_DN273_c0_g2~~TRINITY_DN273_c0_g2_i1.p1  ORF type:complete len:366 (+),score=144.24 TRINITY_DN273_c0_g2_i1:96-1193(+)
MALSAETKNLFSMVQNTVKAVGALASLHGQVKGLRDAQLQDFVELWMHLEEMEGPMQTALRLHCRQATSKRVDVAVRHCNRVIAECEEFLSKQDGEPDERPESLESWRQWMARAQGGRQRLEQVGQLRAKLSLASQGLGLSLQDVLHLPGRLRAARADFVRSESAYAAASSIVLNFLTGRATHQPLCSGNAYRMASSAAGGGACLASQGRVGVVLEWKTHSLCVECAPHTSLNEDEEDYCEEPFSVPLKGAVIQRLWGGTDFAAVQAQTGLRCGAECWACIPEDALCYLCQDRRGGSQAVLLQFEAVPRSGNGADEGPVTAEIFELLCGWAQCAAETGKQQFDSSAELYERQIFTDSGLLPYLPQ